MLGADHAEPTGPSGGGPARQAERPDGRETMPETTERKRHGGGARADDILSESGLARLEASVSTSSRKTIVRSRRVGRLSVSRRANDVDCFDEERNARPGGAQA